MNDLYLHCIYRSRLIWWYYSTEYPLRNTGRRPISYYCPLCFPCFMENIKCQCSENFLKSLNSFTITHIFKWIEIFVAVKIMWEIYVYVYKVKAAPCMDRRHSSCLACIWRFLVRGGKYNAVVSQTQSLA